MFLMIPLKVDFHIKEKSIHRVELALNPGQQLEWTIQAPKSDPVLEKLIEAWMHDYLSRKQPAVDLPICLEWIPTYTRQVLTNLRRIPFGSAVTYGSLADTNGNKAAARAVGNACGRNPCPLIIPCHRVLAKDNHLGGFSCGIEIKKALLDFEGIKIE